MERQLPNTDLILREELAIERTKMANDRTFLFFLRTALYFAIAGLSLEELLRLQNVRWLSVFFFFLSGVILFAGVAGYLRQKRKLRESGNRLGGITRKSGEAAQ
ncbi:MAG TPA: DUF202 domain-containing protein [Chitinophagaceae bacterium]|jgi:putative membrane protein|nr:DUF202 domain-containing protein [Chitinophagaceae bacterium]